jgi:hypothetical protein
LGKVFVVTNESGLNASKEILSKKPKIENSCHIGCAGWHNFDIMSLRKSSYGVIFDYDPQNKILLDITLKVLKKSLTREEFIKDINEYIDFINIKLDTSVERIKKELNREGSWLYSEESFNYIKKMASEGSIATFTVDILDTAIFKELGGLLGYHCIDTVYLSNMRVFIKLDDRNTFLTSLHHIVSDNTSIINCPEFPKKSHAKESWSDLNLRQEVQTKNALEGSPWPEIFSLNQVI